MFVNMLRTISRFSRKKLREKFAGCLKVRTFASAFGKNQVMRIPTAKEDVL